MIKVIKKRNIGDLPIIDCRFLNISSHEHWEEYCEELNERYKSKKVAFQEPRIGLGHLDWFRVLQTMQASMGDVEVYILY